jgi:chromate reductase, NAD(P)H dehydrogenase (quinone)
MPLIVTSSCSSAAFARPPGALAAFGANHHLRQSLVFLNMPTLQQPEIFAAWIEKVR